MKQIVSRDNPGYKALKALAADSREQRRQGRAMIEGAHIIAAYRDKLGMPVRLIVSEHGVAQAEIQALCSSLPDVETLLLRDSLFNTLSGLATPPGILAEICIPEISGGIVGSCVLLDALQDAGNVGSILRSAAAAGITDVFLGSGCAGAWTPRVLRAAQGAHFDLHIREQTDLAGVMAVFAGLKVAATAHDAASLYDTDLRGEVAWLFGSEGRGISPLLESAADRRVSIPMAAGSESLNVAAAAAVCFFEKLRQGT
ncbi:MAG TPA: RNA methyltransferase [Rhodocyclaceae bacterium]|nr:RNA methyltransferase [Rhodocyclaceae bacterium]